MSSLLAHLWRVVHAFDHAKPPADVAFWLNMMESQLQEARAHLAAGEVEKALNELADAHAVSFEAIYRCGQHPTSFIVRRIQARILPRVDEIIRLYHQGDGHKQPARDTE